MGDYNKLIVNCGIKKIKDEEIDSLKEGLKDKIGLCSSAYHAGGEIIHVDNDWRHRTDITIVTQCKYGRGIEEFIDWLKPQVIDGVGEGEVFAMNFSEYSVEPILYKMEQSEL